MPHAWASSSVSKTLASVLYDVNSLDAYTRSRLWAQPPIRLPPMNSRLRDTLPILPHGRLPGGMSVWAFPTDSVERSRPGWRPPRHLLQCSRAPRQSQPPRVRPSPENSDDQFCLPLLIPFVLTWRLVDFVHSVRSLYLPCEQCESQFATRFFRGPTNGRLARGWPETRWDKSRPPSSPATGANAAVATLIGSRGDTSHGQRRMTTTTR